MAALLIVVVLLRLVGCVLSGKAPVNRSQQMLQSGTAEDLSKYHRKTFLVVRVLDGDTIDVDIPDGRYPHTRIRFWGVDTPEIRHGDKPGMYFGAAAAKFTKKLTLGKKVQLFLDEDKTRGKYGRLLAYIKLPDGRFLNELLITEGYAYADLRFRHNLYYKYRQLQTLARRKKKGLWRNVTSEQLPGWLQRERPDLLK